MNSQLRLRISSPQRPPTPEIAMFRESLENEGYGSDWDHHLKKAGELPEEVAIMLDDIDRHYQLEQEADCPERLILEEEGRPIFPGVGDTEAKMVLPKESLLGAHITIDGVETVAHGIVHIGHELVADAADGLNNHILHHHLRRLAEDAEVLTGALGWVVGGAAVASGLMVVPLARGAVEEFGHGQELLGTDKEMGLRAFAEGAGEAAVAARSLVGAGMLAEMTGWLHQVDPNGSLLHYGSEVMAPLGVAHGLLDVGLGIDELIHGDNPWEAGASIFVGAALAGTAGFHLGLEGLGLAFAGVFLKGLFAENPS